MKKRFFFLSMLAALVMTGCTNEESLPTPNDGQELSTGEPRYLAITISRGLDSRSRAEGDAEDENNTTTPEYEHGEEKESKINSVNLYFFDAEGNAAAVKANGSNTMVIADEELNETGKEDDNISNGTDAVIVIQTPKDKAFPVQIVAVINKGADKTYSGKSIDELQEELTEGVNSKGGFVMTNSAYVAGNVLHVGAEVAGHLFSEKDAALASPVTIYVERTLAKVRLKTNISQDRTATLTDGTTAYIPNKPATGETEQGKTEEFNDKQIYVKFLGWNTTAKSTRNRLVKIIDPLWNAGWNWYDAYRFRSFWALNADANTYDYFKFEGNAAAANAKIKFDGSDYTYLKENAADSNADLNPSTPSQVIIAAQLVDEDGKDVEMAEFGGLRMSKDDLKMAFANAATLYCREEQKDKDDNTIYVYTQITSSEIDLITAGKGEASLTDEDKKANLTYLDKQQNKRYLTYANLTEDAAKKVWYAQALNNNEMNPPLTTTQIKGILLGLGGAKVWTNGKTYYYFDIQHLGYGIPTAEFGQFGVVRNHVYDAGVSSLVGLGTPVYDPDEVIIPEKPIDDETFIAAEIKVLSWRIVNNNINLEW